MAELERALLRLAAEIEWPPTPAFHVEVRRRRRGVVAAAAVLATLALAAALAVPQSRGAILRFLHLGGVSIERVETLPPARERPLAASLGVPIGAREAAVLLGRPFAAPPSVRPRLYRSGPAVSALLAVPGPVLLTELRTGTDPVVLKKLVGASTGVTGVTVAGSRVALWISGREHVYVAPHLPPRLAGNTLLWQRGPITYRLEGRGLTLARATELARSLAGQ